MKKGFSLKQYSLAAGALLAPVALSAQAVYTDVDPDIVLDEPGEWWGFDLDGDGLYDFNFFNKSFTTTVWYGDEGQVKALFAGVFDTMQNGLNGNTYFFSGYGGYTYYLPYALAVNISVNSTMPFYKNNYQTMAMTIYKPEWPPSTDHRGKWNSYFWGPQIEKFIGFKFTDEDAVTRYGWIRCSVVDSNRTLIIHDYAYESKPDTPILTGDTIGDTTTVAIQNIHTLNATIYCFENKIYVATGDFNSAIVTVNNLQGKAIIKQQLHQNNTEINMEEFPAGIYLITIYSGDKQFTKKVFIN